MKKQILKTVIILVFAVAIKSYATPSLNSPGLWTDANAGWTVTNAPFSNPSSGATEVATGNTTARILFTGGGLAPRARLYTTGTDFTQNLLGTAAQSINFKLISEEFVLNQSIGSLNMYFVGGGGTWTYQFASPSTIGSSLLEANIGSQGAWFLSSGAGTYAAAIGAVSEFGFIITGANEFSDQHFGVQDVTFSSELATVPEPETVWMILMVLASLGLTFRGRLADIVGQIKARVAA